MPSYENDQNSGTPATLAERVTRAVNPINTPTSCPDCGSTYFFTVYAEQFAAGGHGSVEYRSLSGSPMTLRICPCGHILITKQQQFGGAASILAARGQYYRSLSDAKKHRDRMNPDAMAKIFVTADDLDVFRNSIKETLDLAAENKGLKEEIEDLKTRLDKLESQKVAVYNTSYDPAESGKKAKKSHELKTT